MEQSAKILSDIIVFMKYGKHIQEENRRETWEEIITRNMSMHVKKFPKIKKEIAQNFRSVYDRKVLPSMRALQFGGKPVEISPNRQFNCAYAAADDWQIFGEVMFLLLGGTGVGYSVQKHHVAKLPDIKKPNKKTRRYLINDSIEGWADAVKVLMKAYFFGEPDPIFDYSDIRSKGSLLKTSGGRAPGAQPLKDCLHNLRKVLDAKESGDKLKPIEVHDIMCHIADAVLSGGIRRAALISLFSFDDEEMLTCKFGNWWELNPQRGRANNSVTVLRHRIKKKQFMELWDKIKASGSGEPGLYLTNNAEWGCNPCCEIGLRPNQFCNLTTVDVSDVKDQADLNQRVRAAAFIGTLQASYTDFHYLRDVWKETTEKDALIGVSMTGIASGAILDLDLEEAAGVVVEENKRVAEIIGINPAARTTCIKPEGTASLVVGSASGIHAWHAPYYLRRVGVNKTEPIYPYLKETLPQLMEDSFFKPQLESYVTVPMKAPEGSIFRDEPALRLLERVKLFSRDWVAPGHITGDNTHNVSATVSIKDNEWREVGQWMWDNRDFYNGLSVLPADLGTYKQTPFEDITEDKYNELVKHLQTIDLTKVIESQDNTEQKDQAACGGSGCDVV